MQDQTLEIMTYDNRKLENTFQPGSSDFGCSFVGTGLSNSAFSGTSTPTQTTGSVGCRPASWSRLRHSLAKSRGIFREEGREKECLVNEVSERCKDGCGMRRLLLSQTR